MKKRNGLKKLICLASGVGMLTATLLSGASAASATPETVTLDEGALYNGIVVPADWDYTLSQYGDVVDIPYLIPASKGGYAPEIVNIDKGRQLFVDDFLIDSTNLDRTYYQATLLDEPVLTGKTSDGGSAVLTSGGVWYDAEEKLYKMWYEAGFAGKMAYATSKDGIHWDLPAMSGGDGTNVFLRSVSGIAGSSVWMDLNAEASERYKMLVRQADSVCKANGDPGPNGNYPAKLYVSPDGKRWSYVGDSGYMGDRSTFFYNELLDKWVFSIRLNTTAKWGDRVQTWFRTRAYHDGDTWREAATWDWFVSGSDNNPLFWMKPDTLDEIDTSQGDNAPQLYNLDAVCYESITLGLYQIWYGPENKILDETKKTKITEIQACYSRDGFYFDRPSRGVGSALIPASRTDGTWDYGYLSTTTGGVIVSDDEIRIYYSAISNSYVNDYGATVKGPYFGGAIGYATLRRDGFASMDGTGELLTKPLTATKDVRYLFVNADVKGSLKAEILDAAGNVVEGYSADDCVAFTGDSCCTKLTWKGAGSLSFLTGKGFRIRFVAEDAKLYAFWLSADPEGASGGAMAAGYTGEKDLDPVIAPETETGTEEETDPTGEEKGGCFSSVGAGAALIPALSALALRKRKKKNAPVF